MAISIAIAAAKNRVNNPMMMHRAPTVSRKWPRRQRHRRGQDFRHHATHTSMTWARYLGPAVHEQDVADNHADQREGDLPPGHIKIRKARKNQFRLPLPFMASSPHFACRAARCGGTTSTSEGL
jgi:hypothetical protein